MSTINYPQLHQEQKFNLLIRAAAMQPPVVGSSFGSEVTQKLVLAGCEEVANLAKLACKLHRINNLGLFLPGSW